MPQRFPVNPELLKRIAEQTGGQAFVANDGKALKNSMHSVLDQLEKTRFEAPRSSIEDLFPLLLIPGVVLVGFDVLLRGAAPPEVSLSFVSPYFLIGSAIALLYGALLLYGAVRARRARVTFGEEKRVLALTHLRCFQATRVERRFLGARDGARIRGCCAASIWQGGSA